MTIAPEHLAPTLADRYRIERVLGAGGMATVYLARDLKHDRDVAIKLLRQDVSASLGRERFLREIQLAAKLSHPHILPLFDSGESDGALYYVMPVVHGQSLRDRLDAEGQLPIADAVRIAHEVAGALDHAHRHDVIHRDIKPENIMLQDGHALVADFGIGKAVSDSGADTLTQAGTSIGTPAYMSPEQAVGEAMDGRSDLYSLGCVLYEMLVGEPPFTGPTVQAVIAKRFVQTPADITALREGVPRPVARALQRALNRTPMDRPGSAAEWQALLTALDSMPVAAPIAAPAQSIAVLPFVNLSDDKQNEYFGDGIAEDIINALSRVDGLQVAARMSAFSFKGKQPELRVVGEQLHVATVLQGSVRRAGNRMRITTQLMAVADGYQLWSERYDRDVVDVFVVQDEIASAIADKLQLTFAPIAAVPVKATTDEVEAYELLVRGRGLVAQRGRPILEAIACFERAIALTPNSAAAYACLGHAYRVKSQYGFATTAECHPIGKAMLSRALEMDPHNAEAIGHLATYAVMENVRDRQRTIARFERALELNPRLSEIRGLFGGWALGVAGRGADDARGEREVRRALADDPLNPICSAVFAICMSLFGQVGEGIIEATKAVARDPAVFGPSFALVWCQTWARHTEDGLASAIAAMDRFGRHPWLLQALTGLYMQHGDRVKAEAIHAELTARAVTSLVSSFSLATSAIYLGRLNEAIDHAVRSAHLYDAIGPMWLRWPDIEPLQAHPRYPEVLAAVYGGPLG